jgi:hypothetical protein
VFIHRKNVYKLLISIEYLVSFFVQKYKFFVQINFFLFFKWYNNIALSITIDTKYSSVMDYFEIFLNRMVLCRKAAEMLGLRFKLIINGQQLL